MKFHLRKITDNWWTWLATLGLTVVTLILLRAWLGIASRPFDLSFGWKPFIAWFLVVEVISSRYKRLFELFGTQPKPQKISDLYTEVQTEMQAVRHAKG